MKKYIPILFVLLLVSSATIAITQRAKNKELSQPERASAPKTPASEDADNEKNLDDDPWGELSKIVRAYYDKGGMYYKGTMKLLDANRQEEQVLEEEPFEYTLFDNCYQYRMGSIEMINKKNLLIAIDHDSKTIAYNATGRKESMHIQVFNLAGFKKILEEKKATAAVSQSGTEKIVTIDNIEDPSIQGYRIYYAPETYKISKIEIGMVRLNPLVESEDQDTSYTNKEEGADTLQQAATVPTYTYYLEVNYSESKALQLSEKDFNPEARIIKTDKGHIALTDEYKQYTLLNAE